MCEMNSPDTTMPRRIAPRRMKSLTIAKPVTIPAQALATSKQSAPSAPIARWIATLIGGS